MHNKFSTATTRLLISPSHRMVDHGELLSHEREQKVGSTNSTAHTCQDFCLARVGNHTKSFLGDFKYKELFEDSVRNGHRHRNPAGIIRDFLRRISSEKTSTGRFN